MAEHYAVALRASYEVHDHDDPGVAADEPAGFVTVEVSVGDSDWLHALTLPVQHRYDCEPEAEVIADAVRDWMRSRSGAGHVHTIR